jgi:glycosyltransferase involved in cell wall biosynthesis
MSERVLVVIPALNAERTLPPIVAACRKEVSDVVVVDDGSTDGTAVAAAVSGAQVLRHGVNRGKGAALKTGFAHAMAQKYDCVITLDADGQHLPVEIPRFLEARRETNADLIIGSRAHLFSGMRPGRRLANTFSAKAIAWGSRTRVDDSQSGYRLYSANLLRNVQLQGVGFDMESEVIIRAGLGGYRVISIPIGLGFVDGLSTSHYKPILDTLRIAWTAFKTKYF